MPPPPIRADVINADSLLWMSRQLTTPGTRRYDLVFTDPPFNIGQDYKGFEDKKDPRDFRLWVAKLAMASHDMLRDGGVLCLHGPDALAEMYLGIAGAMGWLRLAWVNWHYRFGQNQRGNWIDSRCHCLIYMRRQTKDAKHTWNPDDVLVASDRAVVYNDPRAAKPGNGKRLPFTVWGLPSDGEGWGRVQGNNKERRGEHPNQLPERYLERLLRAYTNPGDWVLDPTGGSGTTVVVAKALGRNCTTVELTPENAASIKARLKKGAVNV